MQIIKRLKMEKATKRFKKQARALAEKMPLIRKYEVIGRRVLGAEMIKDGITEDAGKKPIEAEGWYKRKEFRVVYVNHFKELLKVYDRDGEAGVAAYMMWVREQVLAEEQRKAAEAEKLKLNEASVIPEGFELTTDIKG